MATKKNKKKATRTEKKVQQLEEKLNIKTQDELSDEDYAAMAEQCECYKNAFSLSMINSFTAKFALLYKGKWYFVTYNRDRRKVGKVFDISFLDEVEQGRYFRFKARVETEVRSKALQAKKEAKKEEDIPVANSYKSSSVSANENF